MVRIHEESLLCTTKLSSVWMTSSWTDEPWDLEKEQRIKHETFIENTMVGVFTTEMGGFL
jgi:hypothetical protein